MTATRIRYLQHHNELRTTSELERWAREKTQGYRVDGDKVIARVLGSYRMLMLGRDLSITPHLCLDGYWESWLTWWLCQNYRYPAWQKVAVVGANVGYYSLILASLAGVKGGSVWSMEPNPEVADCLAQNMHLNGYGNREQYPVIECAISSRPGYADLHFDCNNLGSATISELAKTKDQNRARTVEVRTLDQVLEQGDDKEPFDFVLIDAEGCDLEAIKGAGCSIGEDTVVLFEWASKFHEMEKAADYLEQLQGAGWSFCTISSDGIERPTENPVQRLCQPGAVFDVLMQKVG